MHLAGLTNEGEIDPVHLADLTNAPIRQSVLGGASGSPVFNNKGGVIGVEAMGGNVDLVFIKSHFIKTVLKVDGGSYKKINSGFRQY